MGVKAGRAQNVMRFLGCDPLLAVNLETERFHLRSVGALKALFHTASWRHDPDLMRGLYLSSRPKSLFQWWLVGPKPNNRSRFGHLIVERASGVSIGLHMVHISRSRRTGWTHIGIGDKQWLGRNVSVEVRAMIISHFFRHAPLDRFVASIDVRNIPSIFVYRRLGFAHLGTDRAARRDPSTGLSYDAVAFEMTRERWESSPLANKLR